MSDIASELREAALRAEQAGESLAILDDAAGEIERLRLTIFEWAAIRDSIDDAENDAEQFGSQEARERADTLRAMLERLK